MANTDWPFDLYDHEDWTVGSSLEIEEVSPEHHHQQDAPQAIVPNQQDALRAMKIRQVLLAVEGFLASGGIAWAQLSIDIKHRSNAVGAHGGVAMFIMAVLGLMMPIQLKLILRILQKVTEAGPDDYTPRSLLGRLNEKLWRLPLKASGSMCFLFIVAVDAYGHHAPKAQHIQGNGKYINHDSLEAYIWLSSVNGLACSILLAFVSRRRCLTFCASFSLIILHFVSCFFCARGMDQ